MRPEDILQFLHNRYEGISVVQTYGETTAFYNPQNRLPRGAYFATIKEKDGPNDKASNLNRVDVFRFSTGASREQYFERFGYPPSRPSKGGVVDGGWDFTSIDQLTPHPIYGWMNWMCINNPTHSTFDQLHEIIESAYNKAKKSVDRRLII